MVRDRDQVLRARRVTDQHCLLIVPVNDLIDRIDLPVDLIGSSDVLARHQDQLVTAAVQYIRCLLRQHLARDPFSQKTVNRNDAADAVHIPDLSRHQVA